MPSGSPANQHGQVSRVIDGDTIEVAGIGVVRLQGIDTPEIGECGFEPAANELTRLVDQRDVDLVMGDPSDPTDKYGRLLRYVDVNGVDAGLHLVKRGLAVAKYDSRDGYGFHSREPVYVAADAASDSANGCRES